MHWESGFNTKAVNKGQAPNSVDYGIFQVNIVNSNLNYEVTLKYFEVH